jgi:hypothetical protein
MKGIKMKRMLLLSLIVIMTSCSTPSAIKPVATADVSTGATSASTSSDATATVPVNSEGTPSSEATVVPATPVTPATTALDAQQINVAKEFLTAYHTDPSGDSSAQYLSPELTKLYDGGKTIPSIVGVDAAYTTVTIVDSKLFNDNQSAQITAKLDYANGSQTIDMTLALNNGTWQVAAVSTQPQK